MPSTPNRQPEQKANFAMKVLVTGGDGQLASELKTIVQEGRSDIGIIPTNFQNAEFFFPGREELDIANRSSIQSWFKSHQTCDVVINCASITNVDGCEKNEAEAFLVNAIGAQNLAKAAQAANAKMVQVSTDYVFPGTNPTPRRESDPVCPISAYGRSKWAGEVLVAHECPRSFVVRTAWLYGAGGNNFVKTMLRLAHRKGKISVVGDQFGNPTSANDLAHEILRIAETDSYGLYHCTNEGTCSWFDFASEIVDIAQVKCEKERITTAEYKRRFPASAARPAFSSLDNCHLAETIGNQMRPWREALNSFLNSFSLFDYHVS